MKTFILSKNSTELKIVEPFRTKFIRPEVLIPVCLSIRCDKIKKLSILANELMLISPMVFMGLENLFDLYLNLLSLPYLPNNLFVCLENLVKLELVAMLVQELPKNCLKFNRNLKILKITLFTPVVHSEIIEEMDQLLQLEIFSFDSRQVTLLYNSKKNITKLILKNYYITCFTPKCSLSLLKKPGFELKFLHSFFNLKFLNLDNNLLTFDEIKHIDNESIKILILKSNIIYKLSRNFLQNLKNLRYLDLENCGLYDLTEIGFGILCPSLQFLSLRMNELHELNFNLFALQYCYYLEKLDLSFNRLKTIGNYLLLCDLIRLTSLNLSNNELKFLPENFFTNLMNLKLLDLKSNKLKHFNFKYFAKKCNYKLEILYLQKNFLNSISELTLKNFPKLKKLDLSSNRFRKLLPLNFRHNRQLKYLNLSNNKIFLLKKKHFFNLYNLQFLNLENNKCTIANNSIFIGLFSLQKLSLKGNLIAKRFLKSLTQPNNLKYFLNDFDVVTTKRKFQTLLPERYLNNY